MSGGRRSFSRAAVADATFNALLNINPWTGSPDATCYAVAPEVIPQRQSEFSPQQAERVGKRQLRPRRDHDLPISSIQPRQQPNKNPPSLRKRGASTSPAVGSSSKWDPTPAPKVLLEGAPKRPPLRKPKVAAKRYDLHEDAERAERRELRKAHADGENLGQQRQEYSRNVMRLKPYLENQEFVVQYDVSGSKYFVKEHAQYDPVEAVRARYEVGIQHEDRMARHEIANPWSPEAERLLDSAESRIAAIPKQQLDNMFQEYREAHHEYSRAGGEMFDIPNKRDDSWFKIDVDKKKSSGKKARTKGLSGIFRRVSMF